MSPLIRRQGEGKAWSAASSSQTILATSSTDRLLDLCCDGPISQASYDLLSFIQGHIKSVLTITPANCI